jgi:hypothetical protein
MQKSEMAADDPNNQLGTNESCSYLSTYLHTFIFNNTLERGQYLHYICDIN